VTPAETGAALQRLKAGHVRGKLVVVIDEWAA
jgi:hypothetical protein